MLLMGENSPPSSNSGETCMEDLTEQIKRLLHELEYTSLKKDWLERIIAGGVEKDDAYKWVAEIGHVIDEYESNLQILLSLFKTSDAISAAQKLDSWFAYTRDLTVWKLEDVLVQLKGRYEHYLPPESEDEDEPD